MPMTEGLTNARNLLGALSHDDDDWGEPTRDDDLGFAIVDDAQCTCWSAAPEFTGHQPDCDLTRVIDFEEGFAYWDSALKALIEMPEDIRDAVNSDPTLDPHVLMFDALSDALDVLEVSATDHKSIASLVVGKKANSWADNAWDDSWTPTGYSKCHHVQSEVILPDGTLIYASSIHERARGELIPDLGVYLDGSWRPDCRAFHVGCPDYRTPRALPGVVIGIAREAIQSAREGKRVEVGCIGGHGRTGLMLAIMVLVVTHDGGGTMTGDKATAYVRHMHCSSAIESREQEWYIRGIACELAGIEWPSKPRPRKVNYAPAVKTAADDQSICRACGHWMKHSELMPCNAMHKNSDGTFVPCLCAVGQSAKECGRCWHVTAHGPGNVPQTCWCGCTGDAGVKVQAKLIPARQGKDGQGTRRNNRRARGKGRGRGGKQ